MTYSYVIDSVDPVQALVTITYKSDDPELPPVTLTLLAPNAVSPESLDQIAKDNIPTGEWARIVQMKKLQVVVGDERTIDRALLQPVPEIHIAPVVL